MAMVNGIQSLHSHTLFSDGKMTHQEIMDLAEKLGISTVAFTDHDVILDSKTLNFLKNTNSKVNWISGVELSAGPPKELEKNSKGGVHMLGLFVDPTNKDLIEHCQKLQEQRLTRMKKVVKNFKRHGFEITEQECLDNANGATVVLPHIVKALVSKEKNQKLIEEFVEKMSIDAKNNPEINKNYQKILQLGERQAPYILFFSEDAYVPDIEVEDLYWLDFDASVKLIRQAGGISSIAHYTFQKKTLPIDILEKLLKENRIDCLETVYGLWEHGTKVQEEIDQDREVLRKLLKKYNKLPTGGADSHSIEDFKQFADSDWYSNETIGMVEELVEKLKVDTTWSSY